MQRGAKELDRCRGEELRDRKAGNHSPRLLAQNAVLEVRTQQRRDVEAGKYGDAVPHGEERVRSQGHSPRRNTGRAKHAHKHLVLVDAETDVRSRGGSEFGRA